MKSFALSHNLRSLYTGSASVAFWQSRDRFPKTKIRRGKLHALKPQNFRC